MENTHRELARRPGCGWIALGILAAMLASGYIIAGLAEPDFFANPVAQGYAWAARVWALLGDPDRAYAAADRAAADRAAKMEPENITYLNKNCWYGAIAGHPEAVMDDCERTAQARYDRLWARDSRGVARMLAGDYPGAIEDFQFVVDTMRAEGYSGGNVAQRERFIEAMQEGRSPVTEEDMESLLLQ